MNEQVFPGALKLGVAKSRLLPPTGWASSAPGVQQGGGWTLLDTPPRPTQPLLLSPAPNQCDLNCLAEGHTFYHSFGRVLDGTPCSPGAQGICVAGRCLVRTLQSAAHLPGHSPFTQVSASWVQDPPPLPSPLEIRILIHKPRPQWSRPSYRLRPPSSKA